MEVGIHKLIYKPEELLYLRHEGKVSIECVELKQVWEISTDYMGNYLDWRGNKLKHRLHELSIPPGSVIIEVPPGNAVPPGAKPLPFASRSFIRSHWRRCGAINVSHQFKVKSHVGSLKERFATETNYVRQYDSRERPTCDNVPEFAIPHKIENRNRRSDRRIFRYQPSIRNSDNPYSAGFVPSEPIPVESGYLPQQASRNTSSSSIQVATNQQSIDTESQQSTQESSCDIQIQIIT